MKNHKKILLVLIVIGLIIGCIPERYINQVSAEPLLTFEAAQKYKGIIAPKELQISILQEDGSVKETNMSTEQTMNSEWSNIKFLTSNMYFTVGLRNDGTIISQELYNLPEKTKDWTDIQSISAGPRNLMGLKNDGTVVVAGEENWDVSGWENIKSISAGTSHYVGLEKDGTIIAGGNSIYPYEGIDTWKDIIEVSVGSNHTAGLKKDGTVIATGEISIEVTGWTDIVALASGGNHLIGLRSDGTVVGTGWNNSGQLNIKDWKNIVAVSANAEYTVGLKSDGTVLAIGNIVGGQRDTKEWKSINSITGGGKSLIGINKEGLVFVEGAQADGQIIMSQWSNIAQISIGTSHNLGLKSNGTVTSNGGNSNGQNKVDGWRDIKQVSAGNGFSIGLTNYGNVLAVGYNGSRQLDVSSWTDIEKVYAGSNFTIGLKKDGSLIGTRDAPRNIVRDWTNIKDLAIEDGFILGLKNDGGVITTGTDVIKQANLDGWKDIIAIEAGVNHVVGLKKDGTVLAIGSNIFGQTDIENWESIIAVTAGLGYTAGLKSDGTVVITDWTGTAASDIASVDKHVVKPGDTVRLFFKNSRFYNLQSDEYMLDGSVSIDGHLDFFDDKKYGTSYLVKEADVGQVNISLPGTVDFFGNPLQKKDLFQVLPLQSLTSSKKEAKSGEKVTLTASFYQQVNPDFKLSLTGAVKSEPILMNEVAGSEGKKFITQYSLPADYEEGAVHASLQNISLEDGNRFEPYIEENIFDKSNAPAPVSSLSVSQTHVKIGDIVTVKARFLEEVAGGIKLSLNGGANLQDAIMTEVPGSAGQEFTYDYFVREGHSGAVDAYLTSVFDTGGAIYRKYKLENLFETDTIRPELVKLETTGTTAKLGDRMIFTAMFSESVKQVVTISLSGGTEHKTVEMTEVPGSAGQQYRAEYMVDEKDFGLIHAQINHFEDQVGNRNSFSRDSLFYADGKNPYLVSIHSDEEIYYEGDYAHLIAEFSEPLKSGLKIKLSGAIQNEEYEMSEVPGSEGRKYELYYEVKTGQHRFVNIEISNIEDIAGNAISISQPKVFYISDPVNANLNDLLLEGIEISPSFSPDITEYEATIPFSKEPIAVKASAEDPDATVSRQELLTLVPGANVYTVKVKAKDGTQKDYHVAITAVDKGQPVFSGVADSIIKTGSTFDKMAGITALDEVDGDLTSVIEITGSLNTEMPGQYKLSYSVTDKTGNTATIERSITVMDDQKPIIKGAGHKSIIVNSAFDPKAGVTAEDNVDGNLTAAIKVNGSVNTKLAGIYTLTYIVEDSSGNIGSIPVKITVAIPAPANLKGASTSYNSAKVTWSAVSGATGYEVYRSTSSTGIYSSAGATTGTSFVNSSLATNKVYYYKVKAYQTSGSAKVWGDFSAAVSATPVLEAPVSVKAVSASYNSIKNSWASVSGATGYEVYRATSSEGTYSSVGSTTATSLTNSGLTTNAVYYYKVKAYRTVDGKKVYGPFSALVNTKPVVSAVTSVKSVSAGYSKNKVSWSQVSGASGYIVYRATSKTGTYSNIKTITSGSTLVYENTGLTTGKTYYYKVRAYRVVSGKNVYGLYSGIVSAIPTLAMPSKITLAKVSSTSIKSSWSKVGEASGYELYRATSKAGTYTKVKTQTSGSAITFTNTGLSKGKTYYYKVRAYRIVNGKKIYSSYTPIVPSTL
ncbi:immunoglobulin-like domain-containing protein [Planococcus koreensis]|uniref:immunoglobulin-like domain-containing protein n=1 Tax=Planococcus koreensis TaxID=112331 RepID=UPI0039FC660F